MSRHIFILFHHRIGTPFQFFHTKRYGNIRTGIHHNGQKLLFLDQYLGSSHVVNASTARCYQRGADGSWNLVTLIAGSKWWSLLIMGDNDEVFIMRSLILMLKTTEHHLRGAFKKFFNLA